MLAPWTTFALVASSLSAVSALYVNGSVTAPCDSPLYCQGDILKEIQLASRFADSKTYVDMPTKVALEEVIAGFAKLEKPIQNNSALEEFFSNYFSPAGGELSHVPKEQLYTNPRFLAKINDTVIKEFSTKVIDIWPDLTRSYQKSNCTGCHNSFIPVNRTFIVAGGRFREPYYWDSFWIVEGLLRTGGAFTQIAKNTIENFLDMVETIGFVPNGARIYYLNRSQPPLLSQMLRIYIEQTNDTTLLPRAIPLLIKEHDFFINNRSVELTGSDGQSYNLQRYSVSNNQPRPESFREDYITANNASYFKKDGTIIPSSQNLTESEKGKLYAHLASGAESGWDYSAGRWLNSPDDAARDSYFPLRSLNVVDMVPVDLNSILYWNEITIAGFLNRTNDTGKASEWESLANQRSEAMFATLWNSTHNSYFDYNLTSRSQHIYIPSTDDALPIDKEGAPQGQQILFSVSQLYPFWTGAAPSSLKNNPCAVRDAYKRVATYLDARQGGIPATNFRSGQQWDQPSVWPPLMSVLMEGLQAVPATFGKQDPHFKEVKALALKLGQRYLDSTFCTWRATGGSTSQTPKLAGTAGTEGIMFEKYSDNTTNRAGGGGEYEVVEGFGWTNGVLLWTVDTFGNQLKRPNCGNITGAKTKENKRSLGQSAVELHPRDAVWIKKFGRE